MESGQILPAPSKISIFESLARFFSVCSEILWNFVRASLIYLGLRRYSGSSLIYLCPRRHFYEPGQIFQLLIRFSWSRNYFFYLWRDFFELYLSRGCSRSGRSFGVLYLRRAFRRCGPIFLLLAISFLGVKKFSETRPISSNPLRLFYLWPLA